MRLKTIPMPGWVKCSAVHHDQPSLYCNSGMCLKCLAWLNQEKKDWR